jgi:hypothetical protein
VRLSIAFATTHSRWDPFGRRCLFHSRYGRSSAHYNSLDYPCNGTSPTSAKATSTPFATMRMVLQKYPTETLGFSLACLPVLLCSPNQISHPSIAVRASMPARAILPFSLPSPSLRFEAAATSLRLNPNFQFNTRKRQK